MRQIEEKCVKMDDFQKKDGEKCCGIEKKAVSLHKLLNYIIEKENRK
jgi:hypothetical protein